VRVRKQRFGCCHFDDPPRFHHRHAVRQAAHHRKIMRDEQHRHLLLAADTQQQIKDTRLNRHVQRRQHLVAQHDLRLGQQGTRDRHALTLTARQFRGKPFKTGLVNFHFGQGLCGPLPRRCAGDVLENL